MPDFNFAKNFIDISNGYKMKKIKFYIAIFSVCAALSFAQGSSAIKIDPNNIPQGAIFDLNSPFIKDGRLDVNAVVKHFEDMYRSTSSISEVELIITKPRSERTLDMKVWTKGEDKALIVITSPAREKDTATLKVDNNLWNYLPRINRTIRIPPSLMMSSWMGSDFTNDDLVRETSFSKDYTYKLVGRVSVLITHEEASSTETRAKSNESRITGWQVDLIAKPDIVGLWNKIELILSDDGQIPLQAKYYDRKDRLARTIIWSDVKDFDGHVVPSKMVLTPEDEKGQKTEMIYKDIEFNVTVPDDTFSLSQLERKR